MSESRVTVTKHADAPNYRISDLQFDLRELLGYLYADELDDYIQQANDGNDTAGHIFLVIDRLSTWVEEG